LVTAAALLSGPLLAGEVAGPTQGVVCLQLTTRTTGQNYAPDHVLAVWVADQQGRFVKTLLLRAGRKRARLTAWNASVGENPGAIVDAVTGATQPQHGPLIADWDCRDVRGRPVPDGWYQIMVEFSEGTARGPVTPPGHIRVRKGPEPFTYTPADLPWFGGIQVSYEPTPADAPPLGQPQNQPQRQGRPQPGARGQSR
jgi:hypothetical protein